MFTNPLLYHTNNKNIKNKNIKTIKTKNYKKVCNPMDSCQVDTSDNLLEECIICFEHILNTDEYYFCKNCFIPAHKNCCQEWWFNQYKKQGLCVHCQSKNRLVLLKPHVKRSKAYSFLLYVLRKIGCYS